MNVINIKIDFLIKINKLDLISNFGKLDLISNFGIDRNK